MADLTYTDLNDPKVGEWVRCYHPHPSWLAAGADYQIFEVHELTTLPKMIVVALRCQVPEMLWGLWRFRAEMEPYISCPGCGAPCDGSAVGPHDEDCPAFGVDAPDGPDE